MSSEYLGADQTKSCNNPFDLATAMFFPWTWPQLWARSIAINLEDLVDINLFPSPVPFSPPASKTMFDKHSAGGVMQ